VLGNSTTKIHIGKGVSLFPFQVAHVDKSLAALLRHFDELHVKTNDQHRGRGEGDQDGVENSGDDYAANTEVEDRGQRRLRRNRQGMGGQRPHEAHNNDIAFSKIKFKIPSFNGKYEIAVEQKFTCHDFPKNACVRAATSEFTDFASVWWIEHGKKNPHTMPQTWDALKRIMRARFVPSYYARCDGTSQVIRPTYSCPCPTDLGQPCRCT
jgi:hypothetical protein